MDSKRIAKNTGFLYFRMLIMLFISLYTSRVVLNALGIIDFGVYNVISGFVTMFSLMNFGSASQRFLSYSLGNSTEKSVSDVFSIFNLINIVIIVLVILLGETIGLWFVLNKLNVPTDQTQTVNIIYQLAICSFIILLYTSTASSALIAYEKMSAFAYISIIEAILKLGIAFVIAIVPNDRLVLYAFLMFLMQAISRFSFLWYCKKKLDLPVFRILYDRPFFKKVLGYTSWNCLVGIGVTLANQGQNILLNLFGGPILNTSRGIALQVQGAMSGFVQNFMNAVSPPIVKSWSKNRLDEVTKLYYLSSKISFLLILFLISPVIIKAEFILHIWLGEVPPYGVVFLQIILLLATVSSLSHPNLLVVQASGNLRAYKLSELVFLLILFLGSWFLLYKGFPPQSIFVASLITEIILLIIRSGIVSNMLSVKENFYIRDILGKALLITCCVLLILYSMYHFLPDKIYSIITLYIVSALLVCSLGYYLWFNSNEKLVIISIIRNAISKWRNRK